MIFLMMAGLPDAKGQEAERDPDRPRRIAKAIYRTLTTFWRLAGPPLVVFGRVVGWGLMVPVGIFAGLGFLAVEAWNLVRRPWRDRSLARALRTALDLPEGGVYFVYAERHQFNHFLGPGGVLLRSIDRVVTRDWKRDIRGGLDGDSGAPPLADPERELLERFGISNSREHLPFAVVIGAEDGLRAIRLSKPYRQRRRDGGLSLAEAERRLP
ncbi:MAG: hypothetical protein HKM95_03280 [Inquilinus sp.]|nr:hypothetical protein [Inquilinus sp.]